MIFEDDALLARLISSGLLHDGYHPNVTVTRA